MAEDKNIDDQSPPFRRELGTAKGDFVVPDFDAPLPERGCG